MCDMCSNNSEEGMSVRRCNSNNKWGSKKLLEVRYDSNRRKNFR